MRVRSATSRFASLAILLGLSAGACKSATAPQFALATARARWASVAPVAYTITIARTCECLPEMSGPVTVEVRNGTVVSRHYVRSGAAVANQYAELFPSVNGLFALLDAAVRDGVLPLSAQFDPTLGYPTHLIIGDPATDAPAYAMSEFHTQ